MTSAIPRVRAAVVVLLVAFGCGGEPTDPVVAGPPAAMVVVAGDDQSAPAGTELPAPVVARVIDAAGLPVVNQIVNFRVIAGEGKVFAGVAQTNSAGEARERWTLGPVPGSEQTLEARAVDPTTGAALVFATFHATATSGPASKLQLKTSAAGAKSGAAFTTQPVVEIRDAAGHLVTADNSTVVTMSVGDGATMVGTATATASGGVATFSSIGIRGTAKAYELTFMAAGMAPASQTIDLQAGAVATVAISPSTATLFAGAQQLTAVLKDAEGNTVVGAPVEWTSLQPAFATVSASGGLVTPINAGTTTITATSNGKAGDAPVTVLPFTFTALSAGTVHTCGLRSTGAAYCWGANSRGQLGNGAMSDRLTPVAVSGGHVFSSLAANGEHSCGLTGDGNAYCWGWNDDGQLGDGTITSRSTPTPVHGDHRFTLLAAGDNHTCGITTSGATYCWGDNSFGALGNQASGIVSTTPVLVDGNHSFTALTAGLHTCGLKSTGAVYCWGRNDYGALGNGTSTSGGQTAHSHTPVPVSQGAVTFAEISAGFTHTCGRTEQKVVYCWGGNDYGQVGDGTEIARTTPVQVQGTNDFAALAAGSIHTCALKATGQAYCWGYNFHGSVGNGSSGGEQLYPAAVQGSILFASLETAYHSCGLRKTDGAPYCWGRNDFGQLGDGTTTPPASPRLTPVPVVRQ